MKMALSYKENFVVAIFLVVAVPVDVAVVDVIGVADRKFVPE